MPRYKQRLNPCRRLATLMRPSQPVRQRCAFLNQRLFSICLRSPLRVLRFGTAVTRLHTLLLYRPFLGSALE